MSDDSPHFSGRTGPERGHDALFFSLIRTAVSGGSLTAVPTAEEWRAAFGEACRQTLAGVLYAAVERLPKEQRPPKDVLLAWYALAEQVKRENRRINKEAAELTDRFRRQGRRSAVLKGQGVALLYPEPLLRMPGDIDIWVEGGRKAVLEWLRPQCSIGEVVYHHADTGLLEKTGVEVHFTPSWDYNYFRNRTIQGFFRDEAEAQFAHRVELPEGAGETAVPTPAFNRVYLLLHIYRHLFDEGIGLRQMLDYYYCLRQPATDSEKEDTRRQLRRFGLTRFASAVMYVEQRVFGLQDGFLPVPPDEEEGRFLLDEIMAAGNFGHHDARNSHAVGEGAAGRFMRRTRRNLRFVRHYPGEALWTAPFKVWHWLWRLGHGYLRPQPAPQAGKRG